ncbi:hypothetical protein BRADI_1g53391v3 [Brachypodium distachyon]|uniref:Uncharacterized protein n=1 Tax=Brachypodium distachyon TaxID=15368 RepID=A0A0Q3LAU3_BRADI|nr:hypothetical protein BRADI_1g53391v3 [Brachypodium distachyon]
MEPRWWWAPGELKRGRRRRQRLLLHLVFSAPQSHARDHTRVKASSAPPSAWRCSAAAPRRSGSSTFAPPPPGPSSSSTPASASSKVTFPSRPNWHGLLQYNCTSQM